MSSSSDVCPTANKSWPIVLTDLDWFIDNGEGKKIYLTEVSVVLNFSRQLTNFTQNGWPSVVIDILKIHECDLTSF